MKLRQLKLQNQVNDSAEASKNKYGNQTAL